MFLASNLEKPKENLCFCFPQSIWWPWWHHWAQHAQKTIYHKLPIHRPSGRYVMDGTYDTYVDDQCFDIHAGDDDDTDHDADERYLD